MNAQKPRTDDREPWQPGKRFAIQPLDIAAIRVHLPADIDKEAVLRRWQYVAEAIADHAIARMVRGSGATK